MAETTTVRRDGGTRLILRGELDLADSETLDAAVRRLESERPRILAIDLREVDDIDSPGCALARGSQRAGRPARLTASW